MLHHTRENGVTYGLQAFRFKCQLLPLGDEISPVDPYPLEAEVSAESWEVGADDAHGMLVEIVVPYRPVPGSPGFEDALNGLEVLPRHRPQYPTGYAARGAARAQQRAHASLARIVA